MESEYRYDVCPQKKFAFNRFLSIFFTGLFFCLISCGGENKQASAENASGTPGSSSSGETSQNSAAPAGIAFERRMEPREGAFSILVPKGWKMAGGIFRVNAVTAGGPLNAIEAKCDLSLMSDRNGTVMFRILPDITYAYNGIGGGFFPPGSNYQGAEVRLFENAQQHLKSLFTKTHPNASSVKFLAIRQLPGEIQVLNKANAYTNSILARLGGESMMFRHDAAGAVIEYTEAGTRYREAVLTGIVDMQAAFTWKNTRTLLFRAPANEFDQWRAAMDIIRFSVRFNPEWVLKEAKGQQERADVVTKVFKYIQKLDQEMVLSRQKNREEIMNDNFLVLTGQEEYVNPHTREVEVDTDQYRYRWTTPGGDVYFTNEDGENPNRFMHQQGWELTPVRKR